MYIYTINMALYPFRRANVYKTTKKERIMKRFLLNKCKKSFTETDGNRP